MAQSDPANREGAERIRRIREAVRAAHERLAMARDHRAECIRLISGSHTFEGGAREDQPLNLMGLAYNIYTRNLVARNPKACIRSRDPEQEAFAAKFTEAVNRDIRHLGVKNKGRRIVGDAMFGLGIFWHGIEIYEHVTIDGERQQRTRPFLHRVDFDDFFFDIPTKEWSEACFIGHRYQVLARDVKRDPNLKHTKDIEASPASPDLAGMTPDGGERADAISRGTDGTFHEYEERVTLLFIYFPRDNRFMILEEDGGEAPLREEEWHGPPPYLLLSLGEISGQILPLPPSAHWRDIHDLVNAIMLKLRSQAKKQKTVLLYAGSAYADAERVSEAEDMKAIRCDRPEAVKEVAFAGPNRELQAFLLVLQNLFSWQCGNLDSLGGLSAQAETLGQEELLHRSSSALIQDLQDKVYEFFTEVARVIAWYRWTDPDEILKLTKTRRFGSEEVRIPITWNPDDIEGDFGDYNIEILVGSMQPDTPSRRLAMLKSVLVEFILPLLPLIQAQGGMLAIQRMLNLIARYSDEPDVESLIVWSEPLQSQGGEMRAPGSPFTRRENVRINRPAGTRQGRNAALMQTLLGAGVQGAEMAGLATKG